MPSDIPWAFLVINPWRGPSRLSRLPLIFGQFCSTKHRFFFNKNKTVWDTEMGPIPGCRGLNCASFTYPLFTPLIFRGGAPHPTESPKFSEKSVVHGIDKISLSTQWIWNLIGFLERQYKFGWHDEGRFLNFIIVYFYIFFIFFFKNANKVSNPMFFRSGSSFMMVFLVYMQPICRYCNNTLNFVQKTPYYSSSFCSICNLQLTV